MAPTPRRRRAETTARDTSASAVRDTASPVRDTGVRHVEFVALGENQALAVLVAEDGTVNITLAGTGTVTVTESFSWTGGAMQFIYGMGIDTFEARAAALATQFGGGFALSDDVRAAIRRFEPVY
mgnify:CR=1 FL=1